MFSKKFIRATALLLCCSIICVSSAAASGGGAVSDEASAVVTTAAAASASGTEKTETVYALYDADGGSQNVIVTGWLKNGSASDTLGDICDLTKLENVKGEQTFSASGSAVTWNAAGADIYYRGGSDKELPLAVTLSCTLDGAALKPTELAGKSGRVTLRFDYKNLLASEVTIDGEKQTMYVPFVAITGLILDNENFTNIEVVNGKAVNDGTRTIVVGFALPGMQENLGVDAETVEMPSYVEIRADCSCFEYAGSLTVASNGLLGGLDASEAEDELSSATGKLSESLGKIGDAAAQLSDGASALSEGIDKLAAELPTLSEGVAELISGMATLQTYGGQLADGASELADGAKTVSSGASELKKGLDKLQSSSASLNGAANQVFTALLASAQSAIESAGLSIPQLTQANYASVLSAAASSLDGAAIREKANASALENVTEQVRANTAAIRAQIEAGYGDTVLEAVLAAAGKSLTAQQYKAALAAGQIDEATASAVSSAVGAKLDELTEQQIQKLISDNMSSDAVTAAVESAVAEAEAGAETINNLKAQLDSYAQFCAGLASYTAGVDSADSGSKKLAAGAGELYAGASEYASKLAEFNSGLAEFGTGLDSLANGCGKLESGVGELQSGAKELADGEKEFLDEAIGKLTEALSGELSGKLDSIEERLDAMLTLDRGYTSFSGAAEDESASVRFIYRLDGVDRP